MKLFLLVLFLATSFCEEEDFMFDAPPYYKDQTDIFAWNAFSNLAQFINNVNYLGKGYNIFLANPHSTSGLDPGYSHFNFLELDYSRANYFQNGSPDMRWMVPNNVRMLSYQSCTTSYTSKQVDSMQKYRESLQVSVSAGAEFPAASFSVSADYKQTEETIKNQSSVFIESSAQCALFDLAFNTGKEVQPVITYYMNIILSALESKGTNWEAYYDFFDKYGTHVVDKVRLGSLFGYRYELKIEETQKMKQQGFSVEAAASAFGFQASFGVSQESTRNDYFKSALKSWKQFSVGAMPDPDNDVSAWATQTVTNPMPVSNHIITYDKALEIFTKKSTYILNANQIANLKSRFPIALAQYCQNRLLPSGRANSCVDSTAQITKVNLNVSYLNDIDKVTLNGTKPVLLQNLKSARFLKPERLSNGQIQLSQYYYTGTDDFAFALTRVDPNKSIYQIKNTKLNLCFAPQDCQLNDNRVLNFYPCQQVQCQMWEIIPFDNNIKSYKIRSVLSNKFLITNGRIESEGNYQIQYPDHDCENCNAYFISPL